MKGRASCQMRVAGAGTTDHRPQATRADPLTSGISITYELLVPTADRVALLMTGNTPITCWLFAAWQHGCVMR